MPRPRFPLATSLPRIPRWIALVTAGVLIALAPLHGVPRAAGAGAVSIRVLSNRADLVSEGDAYVRISLPKDASFADLRVSVGRRNVTRSFAVRGNGRILGVVTGLRNGKNVLTVKLTDGRGARLTITNHPKGGPVFSGPQVKPWVCGTSDAGLGKARDNKCNAPTKVTYQCMGDNGFESYDPKSPPSDCHTTKTDQGRTVPYIVRVEKGTQDRGVYEIAVLSDPKKPWHPWAPQRGWNHKLLVPFGASCAPHHSQADATDVMNDSALSRGFMVADSGLNILGENCNTVTSAEALMMLKEHIVDHFGTIRYTIGNGCSGGSIGQQSVSSMYPGLVNGIQPMCSFPDTATTGIEVTDCHLTFNYFNNATIPWTPTQQAAVEGHPDRDSCLAWEALFAGVEDPAKAANCNLPADKVYDPQNNPKGVRCSVHDFQQNVWGIRPKSRWGPVEKKLHHGFGKDGLDNVGVQYGLAALNSGEITADQFVDLNTNIGGLDIDHNYVPQRMQADPGTQRIAWRSGEITDGHQLKNVAIIDLRGQDNTEIHESYYSYTVRARLDAANGTHENQLIWTGPVALVGDPTFQQQSFLLLDQWLSKVEADHRNLPHATKLLQDKPAAAVDACWQAGQEITDMNQCRNIYPYFSNPRIVAGEPFTNDYVKCALKPMDKADYNVTFTDDQWAALQKAFPTGVCDWSKPAVAEHRAIPWWTYAGRPGTGHPLGRAPRSKAFG
jgi:hypothetical protein